MNNVTSSRSTPLTTRTTFNQNSEQMGLNPYCPSSPISWATGLMWVILYVCVRFTVSYCSKDQVEVIVISRYLDVLWCIHHHKFSCKPTTAWAHSSNGKIHVCPVTLPRSGIKITTYSKKLLIPILRLTRSRLKVGGKPSRFPRYRWCTYISVCYCALSMHGITTPYGKVFVFESLIFYGYIYLLYVFLGPRDKLSNVSNF